MTDVPFSIVPQIGALIVAAIASYTDIKTDKIPNLLTLPAALIGFITMAVCQGLATPDDAMRAGVAGLINGILGWILAVVIMEGFHLFLKQIGHGDSKMFGALGAFIGPPMVIITFIYFGLAFGVYSFSVMGAALPWRQLATAYSTKNLKGVDLQKFNEVRKRPLPMAPIIAFGLLLAVVFQHQTLGFLGMK